MVKFINNDELTKIIAICDDVFGPRSVSFIIQLKSGKKIVYSSNKELIHFKNWINTNLPEISGQINKIIVDKNINNCELIIYPNEF